MYFLNNKEIYKVQFQFCMTCYKTTRLYMYIHIIYMYIYIYSYKLFIFMLRALETASQSDKIECHKPRHWTATYKATILKTKPKCFATFNEPLKQISIFLCITKGTPYTSAICFVLGHINTHGQRISA